MTFQWRQNHHTIFITLQASKVQSISSHSIKFDNKEIQLKKTIKPDESFWWVNDREIEIELVKAVSPDWWPCLLKNDAETETDPGIPICEIVDEMKRDKAYRGIAKAYKEGIIN